jgi:hypothetical protein
VQVLHPPQKYEPPPFKMVEAMGLKKYGIEVTLNGMTFLLNFMKIYQVVIGGQTD